MAAPAFPAEAKEPTVEGLRRAAEYYLDDLAYYMLLTGDTAPFEDVCHTAIEFCSLFVGQTRAIHARGQHGFGGEIEFRSVKVDGPNNAGLYRFSANVLVGTERTYSADGQLRREFPPAERSIDSLFRHEEGKWRVVEAALWTSGEAS